MVLLQKKGDNNCHRLFRWFFYEKSDGNNVVAFFYGGGVVKKVMATRGFFFFLWSFWSSLLELMINNEMVIF
jgi:hypothetical protein